MKGIHLVTISYVAILGIVALEASPVADILTECPPVNPRNETIFVPHETDCTKFYSCITGKKGAPLDCPFMDNNGNRLHFNPKLQVCDWPWSAGCQLTSTSSSSPTPTTPSPTTPSPTTPSPTTPSPTTPSPTTPSPTTPSPTTPSPTTPSPTTPSPTTPSPTTPSPTTPSPTTPSPTTPSPTTPSPTTPSPTTPSPTTPSPTTPSPTTPSPTTPSPTTPSPTTPSPTTPSPTIPSPTTPSPTTPSPTTSSPTMSTLPLDSCESDDRIHMLPHKTKCDYYYLCFNGEVNPISQKCDRNLLFNPLLRVCDYPENVKCIKIPPNTDIEESTIRSLITSVSPKLTSPLFSPKPTKALEPSAWKCERNGKRYKVPHERMCNLYYWCVDGIQGTEPVKCESFLLFNPVIGECDYPENVDCYGRSTPPPDPPTPTNSPSTPSKKTTPPPTPSKKTTPPPTPSKKTTPPPTSSKKTTPPPTPSKKTTPPPTPSKKTTPPPTPPKPTTPPPIPREECPPKGSTEKARIAHPCLCNQYYECIDGEKILATCPVGKHFDYKREVCDWVAIVKCIRPIPTFNIIIDNYDDYDDYDATCAPEGRAFQHEINCSAYYICSNGEKILEHCMEGLHFNVTIQTCDFPQKRCTLERSLPTISLKTCPPADSMESVLLPHECECRQYYECVGRKQVLRSCPNGLHFDSVRQICNDPSKVQCTAFTSSTTSRTVSTISTTTKAMDKPSETCPPKGSLESARIPHSCLCNRYYECVEGDRILRKCLNGMYFDDEKKICNSAAKVKCTQPLSSHILINKNNTKCFPDGRAFRHEETCTDYYVCHKGEKILKTCEEGLHFNISLQTCDFPRKKCDLVTPLPIGVCPPAGFAEKLLMPHECDCTKYHECVDGKQILRDCPDGLHYDQVHQMCNDPAKAGCAPISSIVPTASTKIPKSDLKCYDEDSLIPHEHDCTSYYKCSNGKKILKTCPKNLYFNSELRVCDFPENVVCERGSANVPTVPTSTDCPPTGTGPNFPHECDCTKYYKCVDGRKVILICPDGLHYDRVRQMCNDPAKAGCVPISSTVPTASSKIPKSDLKCYDEDRLIPHEHDCTSYYKCSNGEKILKTCPRNLYFNSELRVCDFPENVVCERGSANIPTVSTSSKCPMMKGTTKIPHETNCNLYYVCEDGISTLKKCTPELVFNPILKVCDFAENYVCNVAENVKKAVKIIHNLDSSTCIGTCPEEDPEYAVLLPNDDCKKFCMCSGGVAWVQSCPEPLYFDSAQKICKQRRDAVCAKRSFSQDPSTCIGTCPEEDPEYAVLLPNDDCKKFCLCSNGIAWVQPCPEPLYFDSVDKVCKRKKDAVCAKSLFKRKHSLTINIKDDKEYSIEYVDVENNNKHRRNKPPFHSFNPSSCIGICSEYNPGYAEIQPNEDCKKFCLCNNGMTWIHSCPGSLYFDSVDRICKLKRNVICAEDRIFRIYNNNWSKSAHQSFDNLDSSTCIGTCPEKDPEYAVLLPNDDCKKFCMCSNGFAWVQSCPEPLYFDSVDKICKTKRDAVCGVRSFNQRNTFTDVKVVDNDNSMKSLTNENKEYETYDNLDPTTCIGTCPEVDPEYAVLLPNDDCKKFCMCSNGFAWVQSCPEPLYFDSVDKICKTKRDAVCGVRPFNQRNTFTDVKVVDNDNSMKSLTNEKEEYETYDNLDPTTCIGTCPEIDPEYAVLLPNDDCKKFCMCSNGFAWVQSCPEPLYFDSVDKVCKTKRDAVCGVRSFNQRNTFTDVKVVDNDNSMKSLTNENKEYETHDNLDPTTCIGTCPEVDPEYAVLLPNDDCKKFCMCSNGFAWVQSCPEPLYFDSVDKICKTKRDAVCGVRPFNQRNTFTDVKVVDNDNSMKSLTNEKEEYETYDNLDPTTCIGTCPEIDPEYAVLLPNDDCKKFCMCSNGFAWVQSCPEPLYFDSVDKVCKTKRDAVCGVRSFNQRNTFTDVKVVDNDNSMKSLTNENKEYETHDNLDPTTCIGTCPEVDPEYAVLLPNDDCKKFCMCSNGFAWVQSCPEPLYFDSVDKICKTKRDAVCGVRPFNQRNTFTDVKVVDNDNSMKSLTNENKEYETYDNLDPTTCIGTCPEIDPEYAVLLPNDDCKKFCMCSNGFAWVQSCPEPLYFDSVDKVCKTKRDAVCGVRSFNQRNTFTDVKVVDNDNSMKSLTNENKEYETHDNLDPTTCIGTCPEVDPEYAVLLPNDDCKKFCMCSNGFAWVQSCPEPLYFDSVDKICKTKRDAVCGVRSFNQRNTFTDVKVVDNYNSMKSLTNENKEYETYDNLDPTTCIGTCPEVDPEYAVLLPNDDCKKFCMCSNGFAWVQSCPEPLYFDSIDKVCKTKRDAVCGVRSFS